MKKFRQEITLEKMQKELSRELVTRKRVYPRWINEGRIKQETADFRCLVLEAILFKLHEEIKASSPQGDLFDEQK